MIKIRQIFMFSIIVFVSVKANQTENMLNLDACIDLAKRNNYTIQSSEENLAMKPFVRVSGVANFFPSVNFTANRSRSSDKSAIENNNSSGISVSQHIFSGGSNWYQLADSRIQSDLLEIELRQSTVSIVLSVKKSYYNLMKMLETLKLREKDLLLSKEQLMLAQKRVELGAAVPTDIYQAEIAIRNSQIAALDSKNLVRFARSELENILGVKISDATHFEGISFTKFVDSLHTWENKSRKKNLGLTTQKMGLELAILSNKMAKSAYFPTLALSANYSRSESEFREIYSDFGEDWSASASVTLSIPIFDRFTRKTNLVQSKIAVQTAKFGIQEAEQILQNQVKDTFEQWENAMKVVRLLEENTKLAQQQVELAQQQYELGAISLLDLQNAQNALSRAEITLVQKQYDSESLVATLQAFVGEID